MARIRTIKPEFFTSADIVSVSPLARLLYIGLWCEADREGRLHFNPVTLKMRYLPAETVKIDELFAELKEQGLIRIYEVEGKKYCDIPSFSSHQVINNREKESELPAFEDQNQGKKSRVSDASGTRESGVKAEGKGKEGKGREQGSTRKKREAPLPDDFEISEKMADWFTSQGFQIDMIDATERWVNAMQAKGQHRANWEAAWRNGMKLAEQWHQERRPDLRAVPSANDSKPLHLQSMPRLVNHD